MLRVASLAAVLVLSGCGTLLGYRFEPYAVYVESVFAATPEELAGVVREAVPAELVTRIASDSAGARLRIERRVTWPGFRDSAPLLDAYFDVVEAWSGRRYGVSADSARILPQASAPPCPPAAEQHPLEPLDPPESVAVVVEEPPELIGGLEGLQRRIRYPVRARRAGIEGEVVARFVVDEGGHVSCTDVIVGLPGGINEVVLAAIRETAFKPGQQRGEPVKVRFSLPVRFRLR